MEKERKSNQYGWFFGAAACLLLAVTFLAIGLTPDRPSQIAFPLLGAAGLLFVGSIVLSIFGIIRSRGALKGLSIACCAVSSLVFLACSVTPIAIYSYVVFHWDDDSIYGGDPTDFVKQTKAASAGSPSMGNPMITSFTIMRIP